MALINPYIVGNPVGKTPTFVGRSDILRNVFRVLQNPSQSGLILHGQRRIGKTSLLEHLDSHLHADRNNYYATVVFDLQDKASEPLASVLASLSSTIASSLGLSEVPNLGVDPLTAFRDEWLPSVLQHLPKDKTLALLFDEFDVLADHNINQASQAFFPYFRQIISMYPSRLKFIFVLGRNIADISDIAHSLLKTLEAKHISLLAEDETTKLIRLSETLNNSLKWPDDVVAYVWNLTNGHPYLTQSLCSQVWESLHENRVTSTPVASARDVKAAIELTLESSRSMLEWLWDGLGPAEQVAAAALAEAGPVTVSPASLEKILHENGVRVIIPELKNAPELLEEWDLIQPISGGYKFRVELLRQWIQKYKRTSRVREKLNHLEPDADAYFQTAVQLYEDHAAENALAILKKAIHKNPYHSEANVLLIKILIDLGEFGDANRYIEQMQLFDPKIARLLKIDNLLGMAAKTKNFGEEVRLYNEILKLDPEQPDALEIRARLVGDELKKHYSRENIDERIRINELEILISSKLLNEDEIQKAQGYIKEIQEKSYKQKLKRLKELEAAKHYEEALSFAKEMEKEYPNQIPMTRKIMQLEERVHSQERSEFFDSTINFVTERIICVLASGLMWAPTLWIIIAIKNSDILVGKALGFAKYSTQSIWVVAIMWLITGFLISPRYGYRLEQTCALSAGILTPLVVPALMVVGLRGETIVNPWYYFGLTFLVCVATISGYMVIRYDFEKYDYDDKMWRILNFILAIALNIVILIMCFRH